MKSEDVAEYLKSHPEFFEQYADMLAEIHIPHPHGGRTISISERQIVTLREKSKQLETKLREIIEFGEVKVAIGEKIHRLTVALPHAMVETGALFGETAPHLRSFSYVPLRDGEVFGVLALASEDPQRFYPDMGTLYLRRLGELISAGLLARILA